MSAWTTDPRYDPAAYRDAFRAALAMQGINPEQVVNREQVMNDWCNLAAVRKVLEDYPSGGVVARFEFFNREEAKRCWDALTPEQRTRSYFAWNTFGLVGEDRPLDEP